MTTGLEAKSNEELLRQYQSADGVAFEAFFERNHSLVFNYLLSRLKNRAEAEEAFQQTFLRVHRYIQSYDPSQSALGWVLTIARNSAIDSLREHHSSDGAVPIEDMQLASSVDATEAIEAKSSLREIFKILTPEEQAILQRKFLSEESYEEIARSTGTAEVNIRKRVSRLLRRIRTQLNPT